MSRGNNSDPRPPRFVSWAAVSSLPQAEKISLSDQLAANRTHVERWGGVVVEELVVPGESRSIVLFEDAARRMPAYARLKELIDARSFDVLVYLDRSRLGRKASLSMAVVELCAEAGIACYETTAPPSSLDADVQAIDGRLVGAIKSVMAQDEIAKFVRRAHSGKRGRVLGGRHTNVPPYGYKRVYDEAGHVRVVVDETQAGAVRLFYELYLEHGYPVERIGHELEARSYVRRRSVRPWPQAALRQFLLNRWVYAGYSGYGHVARRKRGDGDSTPDNPGEGVTWAKAEWEPLITEDMARRAEAEMQRRRRAVRAVSSRRRLSMVAVCDMCGATEKSNGDASRVAGGRAVGYICANRCRGGGIRESVMVDAIRAVILDLRDDANLESLMVETPPNLAERQARLEQDSRTLDGLRAQRKTLTLTFMRGTITQDEYEALMADHAAQIETLERAVGELTHELAQVDTPADRRARLEDMRDYGEGMLDHPDPAIANRWLRQRFRLYVRNNQVCAVEVLPGVA